MLFCEAAYDLDCPQRTRGLFRLVPVPGATQRQPRPPPPVLSALTHRAASRATIRFPRRSLQEPRRNPCAACRAPWWPCPEGRGGGAGWESGAAGSHPRVSPGASVPAFLYFAPLIRCLRFPVGSPCPPFQSEWAGPLWTPCRTEDLSGDRMG